MAAYVVNLSMMGEGVKDLRNLVNVVYEWPQSKVPRNASDPNATLVFVNIGSENRLIKWSKWSERKDKTKN